MRVLLVIALCFLVSPVIYSKMLDPEVYGDFYPNGQTKTLRTTRRTLDGELINHGKYASYYENGQVKMAGSFEDDLRHGEWLWFYDTGELMARCNYTRGVGIFNGYYKNGQVLRRGEFHDNERHGVWTEWWETGGKKMEGPFVDDQQDGVWKYWAEHDQSRFITAEWKNGERVDG